MSGSRNTRERDVKEVVVPVVAEQVDVEARKVKTGAVRVEKRVVEREETVDMPLLKENVDVHRVVVNRPVDSPPPIRQEGETTIIPIVEEVLVVEKRLMLKEELHLTKRRSEHRERETVVVRGEVAEVAREDAEGNEVPTRINTRTIGPLTAKPPARQSILEGDTRAPRRRNRIL